MAYYNFKTEGSSGRGFYLGTLGHGATMNVAAKYDDYASLTSENFVIVPQSNSAGSIKYGTNYISTAGMTEGREDSNTATYSAPSINYNPSTGQLSFSSTVSCGGYSYGFDSAGGGSHWGYTYPSASTGLTAKVYLIPEIVNL